MITNVLTIALTLAGGTANSTGDCGQALQHNSESQYRADYCHAVSANYTVEFGQVVLGDEDILPAPSVISLNDTQNDCNVCNKVGDGSLPGNNTKSNDPIGSDKTPPVREPCVENDPITTDK